MDCYLNEQRGHLVRILFLIRSLGRGGAERQLVLLANGLAARGHTVGIATFYPIADRAPELDSSILYYNLGKRGRWDLIGFLGRYAAMRHEFKPDIIHSYMPTANLVATCSNFLGKSKIVWGIRTTAMPHHLYRYGIIDAIVEHISRYLSAYPDLIICNSEAGLRWCRDQGFPTSKTIEIANGIESELLGPSSTEPEIKVSLRIPASAKVVGFFGRLDPVKNIDLLLEAFAKLRHKDLPCHLVIVGDGSEAYRSALLQRVTDLGLHDRVLFLPGSKIEAAVRAFDVGVSTSLSEGFSNTIAEMMSAAVPCVVTDVGDSARIVGDTGIAVPSENVDAFATALTQLLQESPQLASARRLAARQRIQRNFSVGTLIERTEAALAKLLGSPL